AAGAACGRTRPANVSLHFLGVASFDEPVTIEVEMQRSTRVASSVSVAMHQSGRAIARAMVWAIDDGLPGLQHDHGSAPDAADWRSLPTVQERCAADGVEYQPNYRFWLNFEQRPTRWISDWANRTALAPEYLHWLKMVPRATFDDPWVDAGRLLLMVDLGAWPAASAAHVTDEFVGPSIDVSCEFHRVGGADEWVLLHGVSPHAGDGLIASHQQVWNDRGQLLASGVSHLLCRPIR
ncbi:MAG: acyl-CoA thioesterase, partial [Ilumatobacteraceae bacterium]|nr:acyl-CoA thioesterase [Ilumatobacteraceae bacterium]